MNLAETYLGEKFLEQGIKLIMHNPEKNINRLLKWAEKIVRDPNHKEVLKHVQGIMKDPNNNWYHFAQRMLKEVHPNLKACIAKNFFVNATMLGVPKQKEIQEKYDMPVPFAILMDPTEKCNLRCKGCWAGDYQQVQELDFELMDRICTEAEEIGIYFIAMSGGEPTLRIDDIFRLAEKHSNQIFFFFTNGTLITEDIAREITRLGNITLAISIEGFEETTDQRRGKGVFQKVMNAMDILREAGAVFGYSTTYTRKNIDEVSSEEFVDLMIKKGALFAWYFTYIPIGRDVDMEFMATPEQRAYLFERIEYLRDTKPIFLMDFWNDGEVSNGCIAGGRRYFHINAAGDVEPCAFVHYATCNIKNISLIEALRNPLFKAYQKRQPFHSNPRRPCPLIDNPEALREMVKETGAFSTQVSNKETVDEFADKLLGYSKAWGEIADLKYAERLKQQQRMRQKVQNIN